jgi:hypothetical protein
MWHNNPLKPVFADPSNPFRGGLDGGRSDFLDRHTVIESKMC